MKLPENPRGLCSVSLCKVSAAPTDGCISILTFCNCSTGNSFRVPNDSRTEGSAPE